jgi:hypothetical protein
MSKLTLVVSEGVLCSVEDNGELVPVWAFSSYDGGGPRAPIVPEVAGDKVRFRDGLGVSWNQYLNNDYPRGDICTHHVGHIQPDGSVQLVFLGGTQYHMHLVNGRCWELR